jgi:glycosyltransferase involved in cell wall biosynthesis
MAPLVTVVIAAFNGERFIADAIESVLAQTHPDVELIVVDDGSEDGTVAIVEGYGDRGVRVIRQANAGPAAARNTGIAAGTGGYVCYLDHDDLMPPRRLEQQVAELEARPEIGVVLGLASFEMLEEGMQPPIWAGYNPELHEDLAPPRFSPPTLLARREAFEELGGFSSEVLYTEDADFVLRANDLGVGTGLLDEPALVHRVHETNLSHDIPVQMSGMIRTMKRRIDRHRAQPSLGPGLSGPRQPQRPAH